MATSDRGFASISREKVKLITSKGGKAAHVKGTAHEWTPEQARAAALKSAAKRKENRAKEAALRLMAEFGFTAEELNPLNLSFDEWLYYGGSKTCAVNIEELRERIRSQWVYGTGPGSLAGNDSDL